MKKRGKYIPPKRLDPIRQAAKVEELFEKLEVHRRNLQAIGKSHDNHIFFLGNFARHDIKNAIQSMDSILTTTSPYEFDDSKIEALQTYLEVIRSTIDNFAKLVPYSSSGKFNLSTLMVAVELLARTDIQNNDIQLVFDYPRTATEEIDLPFQIILQMMNNLIINSIKALENIPNRKMLLRAGICGETIELEIKDNGCIIEHENEAKIFEYGYSTTGGSGIGLYHARFLCEEFQGKIQVHLGNDGDYNKTFSITLPINLDNGKNNLDY